MELSDVIQQLRLSTVNYHIFDIKTTIIGQMLIFSSKTLQVRTKLDRNKARELVDGLLFW